MTTSLSSFRSNFETSFSIRTLTPAPNIMSSGGRGSGFRSYASGAYDPRSNHYRTGSYNQGITYGNRNPGHIPAHTDTSRRRSMNIEDMLNPSDETTRPYHQPQSRRSEAGRTVSRNPRIVSGSLQGNRAPRYGSHSHGPNGSARPRAGGRPPPTQGQRSRGSGSPDVPSRTRAFRPAYNDEEEHFIWYLRIDVRICPFRKSWPDLTLEPRGMPGEILLFRLAPGSLESSF